MRAPRPSLDAAKVKITELYETGGPLDDDTTESQFVAALQHQPPSQARCLTPTTPKIRQSTGPSPDSCHRMVTHTPSHPSSETGSPSSVTSPLSNNLPDSSSVISKTYTLEEERIKDLEALERRMRRHKHRLRVLEKEYFRVARARIIKQEVTLKRMGSINTKFEGRINLTDHIALETPSSSMRIAASIPGQSQPMAPDAKPHKLRFNDEGYVLNRSRYEDAGHHGYVNDESEDTASEGPSYYQSQLEDPEYRALYFGYAANQEESDEEKEPTSGRYGLTQIYKVICNGMDVK